MNASQFLKIWQFRFAPPAGKPSIIRSYRPILIPGNAHFFAVTVIIKHEFEWWYCVESRGLCVGVQIVRTLDHRQKMLHSRSINPDQNSNNSKRKPCSNAHCASADTKRNPAPAVRKTNEPNEPVEKNRDKQLKSKAKYLPGDWICPSCDMNNFASRSHCLQCGAPGVDAVRPADRPGDWSCPRQNCKYHNFASRTQCYKCNALRNCLPTPLVEIKEREGNWSCPNAKCRFRNFNRRKRCIKCGSSELGAEQPSAGQYQLFSGASFFHAPDNDKAAA